MVSKSYDPSENMYHVRRDLNNSDHDGIPMSGVEIYRPDSGARADWGDIYSTSWGC